MKENNSPKNGPIIDYHSFSTDSSGDRCVKSLYNYKNNKKDGYCTDYYENGVIEGFHYYKDGKEEGEFRRYYENSDLWMVGNYKDGKEEGLWRFYHRGGELDKRGDFKDGKKEGEWIRFHNDEIWRKETYVNGNRVSEQRFERKSVDQSLISKFLKLFT